MEGREFLAVAREAVRGVTEALAIAAKAGEVASGFAKVENQIDAYERVTNFLKSRVPPADCGCKLNE